ncbi:hypothetical protein Taro_001811, partial [Colocasia esculenta]|nr:hypothetical protein [Colocasia esculenta]
MILVLQKWGSWDFSTRRGEEQEKLLRPEGEQRSAAKGKKKKGRGGGIVLEDLLSNCTCSSRTWILRGLEVLSTVYLVGAVVLWCLSRRAQVLVNFLNSQAVYGVGRRAYLLSFFESSHSKRLESSCSRLYALVLVVPPSRGGGHRRHKLCSPNHLKILYALWLVCGFLHRFTLYSHTTLGSNQI